MGGSNTFFVVYASQQVLDIGEHNSLDRLVIKILHGFGMRDLPCGF
jgi:hypothetical protein